MILVALALAIAPPPGWAINENAFAKDVCTERDDLRSDAACHRAWLRYGRHDAQLARRICTWPIRRLAELPDFAGGTRHDRMIRAAIEKENDCD